MGVSRRGRALQRRQVHAEGEGREPREAVGLLQPLPDGGQSACGCACGCGAAPGDDFLQACPQRGALQRQQLRLAAKEEGGGEVEPQEAVPPEEAAVPEAEEGVGVGDERGAGEEPEKPGGGEEAALASSLALTALAALPRAVEVEVAGAPPALHGEEGALGGGCGVG